MSAIAPIPGSTRIQGQVARFLGLARSSEEQLYHALILVAERHERNFEVQQGTTVLAAWSRQNFDALEPLIKRYGDVPSDQPARLRSALLTGTRVGAMGVLMDLQDLSLLVEQCSMAWTMLFQGAKELHDQELLQVAADARDHNRRQLAWLRTEIEHDAPETLAVAVDASSELAASRPKRLDAIASIPDLAWAPTMAGVLLLVVGLGGLLVGRPWLLPSLGPTAVLQVENAAHPTARIWNVIVGHVGGLLAGFVAVLLVRAANAPAVLADHVLVPERVAAAVLAIVLTVLLGGLLRASHPPAAATTLLVALGSIRTLPDALSLVGGVLVLALVGEAVRRVRLERVTPAERMAPQHSLVKAALRR
jgi:hypothetical protein